MLSLKPGETLNLGVVHRIRLSLKGTAAEHVEVWQTENSQAPLRRAGRNDFVLDLDSVHIGKVTLELRPTSRIAVKGQIFVEVRPIADQSSPQTYDLTDVRIEDGERIPLAEVAKSSGGVFQLTSLIGARRAPTGEFSSPSRPVGAAILIDRSASMAWTFQMGLLNSILSGLMDGLSTKTSAETVRCFTYGAISEDESLQEVQRVSDRPQPFECQPALFCSGARIPWSSLPNHGGDLVFVVTDDPEPAPSKHATEARYVSFIRPSGTADIERFPRELRLRIQACDEAGCPVLVVPPQDHDQVSDRLANWAMDQVKRYMEEVSRP